MDDYETMQIIDKRHYSNIFIRDSIHNKEKQFIWRFANQPKWQLT